MANNFINNKYRSKIVRNSSKSRHKQQKRTLLIQHKKIREFTLERLEKSETKRTEISTTVSKILCFDWLKMNPSIIKGNIDILGQISI